MDEDHRNWQVVLRHYDSGKGRLVLYNKSTNNFMVKHMSHASASTSATGAEQHISYDLVKPAAFAQVPLMHHTECPWCSQPIVVALKRDKTQRDFEIHVRTSPEPETVPLAGAGGGSYGRRRGSTRRGSWEEHEDDSARFEGEQYLPGGHGLASGYPNVSVHGQRHTTASSGNDEADERDLSGSSSADSRPTTSKSPGTVPVPRTKASGSRGLTNTHTNYHPRNAKYFALLSRTTSHTSQSRLIEQQESDYLRSRLRAAAGSGRDTGESSISPGDEHSAGPVSERATGNNYNYSSEGEGTHPVSGYSSHNSTNERSNFNAASVRNSAGVPSEWASERGSEYTHGSTHPIASSSLNTNYFSTFFQEIGILGKGGQGKVSLVRHVLNGEPLGLYACKRVAVGDSAPLLLRILKEVHLLEEVAHPNIVAYHHAWVERSRLASFGPSVTTLHILMEYARGGSLAGYIAQRRGDLHASSAQAYAFADMDRHERLVYQKERRRNQNNIAVHLLRIDEIISLFRDICEGLMFLHNRDILHLDLKSENVLLQLDDTMLVPRAKISDFGSSDFTGDAWRRERTGASGTLDWSPPESFEPEPSGKWRNPDRAIDQWALGLLLHLLSYFALPYTNLYDNIALEKEIKLYRGFFPQDPKSFTNGGISRDVPPPFLVIMRSLINQDPQKRPSCERVLELLMQAEEFNTNDTTTSATDVFLYPKGEIVVSKSKVTQISEIDDDKYDPYASIPAMIEDDHLIKKQMTPLHPIPQDTSLEELKILLDEEKVANFILRSIGLISIVRLIILIHINPPLSLISIVGLVCPIAVDFYATSIRYSIIATIIHCIFAEAFTALIVNILTIVI